MPNVRAVRAAIDKSLDIAGQLTGPALAAALTAVMPGPAGSIIAAVNGQALTTGISEALDRRPTTVEARRIVDAAEAALVALGRYADEGTWPRTDGFLEDQLKDRSHGDEAIEAVLGAAKSSFEERKTARLGELTFNAGG